jgi:hypothetical protein
MCGYVPFFFIPLTAITASVAGAWDITASDMLAVWCCFAISPVQKISNTTGERKVQPISIAAARRLCALGFPAHSDRPWLKDQIR